jgi:hypothetical protein
MCSGRCDLHDGHNRRSSVSAPLNRIPLFVRAGSIVPMGPLIQYATQSIDSLAIRIYKGGNASFTLYEDEGDTYNHETGKYALIKFTRDEAAQKLTIGARSGSYTEMPTSRTFQVVWVAADHGTGVDVTATANQSVKYDGSEVTATVGQEKRQDSLAAAPPEKSGYAKGRTIGPRAGPAATKWSCPCRGGRTERKSALAMTAGVYTWPAGLP